MKLDIIMLIHNKDDIEFVTEFPCFLGHPVHTLESRPKKRNLHTLDSGPKQRNLHTLDSGHKQRNLHLNT